jgi:hypothetical protein
MQTTTTVRPDRIWVTWFAEFGVRAPAHHTVGICCGGAEIGPESDEDTLDDYWASVPSLTAYSATARNVGGGVGAFRDKVPDVPALETAIARMRARWGNLPVHFHARCRETLPPDWIRAR